MLIITALAIASLAWLIWQLIKAKQFNRFKQQIDDELKDKVITNILEELEQTRSETFPNNDCHIQATLLYWTQYKSRILHAALQRDIITEQWLKNSGNLRNAQHLFYIESAFTK
ncbi:MAG: hypothetical protein QF552_11220 [Litorilituus sp.]|jgi:hypothetical protein|nr:hypothetical protein [Litorilituus sp.]